MVGRLGGDEFGVILAQADMAQAQEKANQLLEIVAKIAADLNRPPPISPARWPSTSSSASNRPTTRLQGRRLDAKKSAGTIYEKKAAKPGRSGLRDRIRHSNASRLPLSDPSSPVHYVCCVYILF